MTISCPRNEALATMTVLRVSQVPEGGYPPMPPDVFVVDCDGVENYPGSTTSGRLRHHRELKEANSVRRRCRHYVKGALHNNMPSGAYIVRSRREGLFDFVVAIQKARLLAEGDERPGLMPDPVVYDFASVVGTILDQEENAAASSAAGKQKRKNKQVPSLADRAETWSMEQETVVKVWFLREKYIPLASRLVDLGESLRLYGKLVVATEVPCTLLACR